MLPSFAKKSVYIYRAPYIEKRGTQVRDWEHVSIIPVTRCSFQPVSSDTAWTDPSQAVTSTYRLFMPPGTDVMASDRIMVDGVSYAINGAPHVWESPTGAVSHVSVDIIEWEL